MTGLPWLDPVIEILPTLVFFAASIRFDLQINRKVKRFRVLKCLPQR